MQKIDDMGKKPSGGAFVFTNTFLYLQQPISLYDYRSVITFGGWKDDFMIVVTQLIESAPHHYEHRTQKLLFVMPKTKVNIAQSDWLVVDFKT